MSINLPVSVLVTVESKVCPKCKKRKPAKDFWHSSITKDGLFWYCKKCEIERGESRRRAAGQKEQKRQVPKRKKMGRKEKVLASIATLKTVQMALKLAEIGELNADLLKATQRMVRQTLDDLEYMG